MALQLTKIATVFFSGQTGKPVLLGIESADGSPVNIVARTYNGATKSKKPFGFDIAAGDEGLVVIYVATEGTQVRLVEIDPDDPANKLVLADEVFHKVDPTFVVAIRGK